jgi:hypothetical protein
MLSALVPLELDPTSTAKHTTVNQSRLLTTNKTHVEDALLLLPPPTHAELCPHRTHTRTKRTCT